MLKLLPPKKTYSPESLLFLMALLGVFIAVAAPPGLYAGTTYRAIGVAPSVYRQTYSKSKATWGSDALLQQGMRLNPEDRLISKGSGMATVICENGSYLFKKRSYTQVSSFCQSQRAAPIQAVPGNQDDSIPYLLEPRATLVQGPPIRVRWNPVAGVRRYQLWLVRLRDRRLLWGTQVVDAAQTALPAGLALAPGESYRLVVEAEDGTSSQLEPSSAQLRFGLLPQGEVPQLERDRLEIQSLRTQKINPLSLVLLEAGALEQRGLMAEAITMLEHHERQLRSLEGQLQLGRLSRLQGLNLRALEHFREAALLAQAAGNEEALREAQEGLSLTRRLAGDSRRPTQP